MRRNQVPQLGVTVDATTIEQFWRRVDKSGSCWLWQGGRNGAHGQFNLSYKPVRVRLPAHVVAWVLEHGEIPVAGQHVLQRCGERLCVRADHLFLGTQADFARWDRTRLAERFWERVDNAGGPDRCWPWTGGCSTRGGVPGYGAAHWEGKPIGAHVLAFKLAKGDVPDGEFVCHSCDHPPCCNPAHLFAAPPAGNTQDMVRKGRSRPPSGLRHPFALLSAEEVREARRRYAGGESTSKIAADLGVRKMVIWQAATGRSYRDVV